MANGGQIRYSVGFDVNKTGLNEVKAALQEIQRMTANDVIRISGDTNLEKAKQELREAQQAAKQLQSALNKAYNQDLGAVNVNKFNTELQKSNIKLNEVYQKLGKLDYAGHSAFRKMASEVLTTNMQLKETHNVLDKMSRTMANTVKWGVASSIMNTFTNSISQAFGYVKHLDTSLNDIRIVTGKSADEMERFSKVANTAAQNLGQSTTAYTEASLIYYQQGLDDEEVQARAETTLKAANVTGQTGAEVSEQLTAVWNGYKVSAAETEIYVDKLAAVAASTASDLEELSTGMSKVASAASTAGVDIDQLNATLATVVSVTRQAPESVGTAFKTIYARMGDLAVDGVDEFGTKLGSVSSKMKTMGIEILDETGNMRDMGTIVEEVAAKWDTWTEAQKQAAAVAMAGKRQYNNLIALFENWDMYEEALATSQNSLGTLQNQQDIYMESTAAHLKTMKAAWEGVWDSLIDSDAVNGILDIGTAFGKVTEALVDGMGGGINILMALGATGMRVFDKQISQSIATSILNLQKFRDNARSIQASLELTQLFKGAKIDDGIFNSLTNMKSEVLSLGKIVSAEQHNMANSLIEGTYKVKEQQAAWKDNVRSLADYSNELRNMQGKYHTEDMIGPQLEDSVDISNLSVDSTEYEDLSNAITEQQEKIKLASSVFNDYEKELKEIDGYLDAATQELKEFNQEANKKGQIASSIDQMGAATKESFGYLQNLAGQLEKYQATLNKSDPSQKRITNALTLWKGVLEGTETDLRKVSMTLMGAFRQGLATGGQSADQMAEVLERLTNGEGKQFEDQVERMERQWAEFIGTLNTQSRVQGFVNLIGGIGQVASGLQSLVSLSKTLQSEDLSNGEKVLQLVTTLTFVLPMMISGVKATGGSLVQLAISFGVVDKSAVTAAGAIRGFGMSLAAIMPYALPILAVLTLLGLGIHSYIKEQRAAEEAMQDAKDTADSLHTSVNNLKTGYQELGSTIDDLKEQKKTLASLKEGTDEWKEAVGETTDKVLELIKTYPELAKYVEKTSDGNLTITDSNLDKFMDEYEDNIKQTERISSIADVNAIQAEADYKKSQIKKVAQVGTGYYDAKDGSESTVKAEMSDAQLNELIQAYEEYGLNIPKEELMSIFKGDEALAGVVKEKMPEIAGLIEETNGLIEAATIGSETNAKELIEAQSDYDKDKVFDETVLHSAVSTRIDESSPTYQKELTAAKSLTKDEKIAKYSEITGATVNDSSGKKPKFNVGGQAQEVSWDDIEKIIAADATANEAATHWKRIEGYLENIRVSEIGQAVSGSLAKTLSSANFGEEFDLSGLTQADIDAIAQKDKLTPKELGITTDMAKEQGYADGKAMADAFLQQIRQNSDSLLQNSMGEFFSGKDIKNLSKKADEGDMVATKQLKDVILSNPKEFGLYTDKEFHTYADKDLFDKDYQFGGLEKESRISHSERNAILDTAGVGKTEYDEAYTRIAKTAEGRRAIATERPKSKDGHHQRGGYDIDYEGEAQSLTNLKKAYEDYQAVKDGTLKVNKETEESLKEQAQLYKETQKQVEDLAAANIEMNDGFGEILEGFDEWSSVLKDEGKKGTDEYAQAMDSLKDSMAKVLNVDPVDLSDKFITDNLDDIQKAADGDAEALERLRAAASEDIVAKFKLEDGVTEKFQGILTGLQAELSNEKLEVGATLNDSEYIDKLNAMMANGDVTARQVNKALNAIGYEPKISWVKAEKKIGGWPSAPKTVKVLGQSFNIPKHIIPEGTIKIRVPKITGGNKKDSTYNPISGGGSSDSSSNAPSGGGGGGGGGGSTPEHTTKSSDPLFDRYHDIDVILKKLGIEMDRLAERQDKLFGKDLLDNLNAQLDVIKEQVEATREKLAIAQDEAKEMRTQRKTNVESGVYNDLLDFGIKFDDDGDIINYKEVMTQWDNKVNSMERYWTSQSAAWQASEAGKKYEKEIEKAKQNREMLANLIGDYEELIYDKIPGLMDEITQMAYDMITIQIEKFNIEVGLRMDMTEAIKDWREFEREVIKDLDTDQLVDWGKSLVQETQDVINTGVIDTATSDLEKKLAFAQEVLSGDTSKISANNPYASFIDGVLQTDAEGNAIIDKTAMWEDIDKSREEIQENLKYLREQENELEDAYYSSIDAIGEAVDKQAEAFERVNDTLNHTVSLLEMIKGEAIYADKAQVYDQMFANNLQALEAARKAELYYKSEYEKAVARGATKEEIEQWEGLWLDAQDNVRDAAEQTVEILTERFSNAVLKAIDDMDKALTDGRGLDSVQLEWEMNISDDDRYLDGVNRAFALQDLNNKINQSINDTNSLSAQKRLNDLRDKELKKLREKEKLTQYDVDRANALYDIELKKIALEEAQNNKSQMRLRRDASGNYSYQFVADQDSITEAQNELMEAYNNLYNMDKEQRKEMEQNIMDLQNALKESMQEFSELSVEEQKARRGEYEQIWAHYNQQIADIAEEATVAQSNLIESTHDAIASTFRDMSETERQIMADEMVPHFSEAVDTMIAKINGNNGLGDALNTAIDDIFDASQALADGIGMIESTLDLDSGSLSDITSSYYADAAQGAKDYAAAQQENIDKAKEEKAIMLELWDTIKLVTQGYLDMASAATQAVQAAAELKTATYGSEADDIADERSTSPGTATTATENNVAEVGDTATLNVGGYTDSSDGKGEAHTDAVNTKVKIAKIEPGAASPYQIAKLDGGILGWVTLDQLTGYDTGGYTGSWNDRSGRLALLHQKELVLNEHDTKNILTAVEAIRDISAPNSGSSIANILASISKWTESISNMLAGRSNALSQYSSSISEAIGASMLNMNTDNSGDNSTSIEIHADFPAATSTYEIEAAFNSLINNASQYTHSTRR